MEVSKARVRESIKPFGALAVLSGAVKTPRTLAARPHMSSCLRRTKALHTQLTRPRAISFSPPTPRTTYMRMSSVRRTYLLPIVLVATIAIGLRQYLQTGNEAKITDWVSPHDKSGEFKRGQSAFRNFISREPGAQFPPEKDRYHLYVSYACPWGMASKLCFADDEANIRSPWQHTGRSSCAS